MAHCISPNISDFYNYPSSTLPMSVWKVTGSPCTGTRTNVMVYYNAENNLFYADEEKTILLNGTFFDQDNTLGRYIIVEDGIPGDPINNVCPLTSVIRWKDMGQPSCVDRYGNTILAAYANKHVVVKYTLSPGETNPIGTIVAGTMNIMQRNRGEHATALNYPSLVKWREDGQRFAVFNSGNCKSIKVFDSNGNFLWSPSSSNYFGQIIDPEWDYNKDGDYATTPKKTGGLLSLMTPTTTNVDDIKETIWAPSKLEYFSGTSTGEGYGEVVMLGLANKHYNSDTERFVSAYKMYSIFGMWDGDLCWTALFNTFEVPISDQYTAGLFNISTKRKEIRDVIPDFTIMRKSTSSSTVTYDIAFVFPRAWTKSGDDKYRYYEQQEYKVAMNYGAISYTVSNRYVGSRRIYNGGSGVYNKNVRASIARAGNNLYVYVRATDLSFWDYTDAMLEGAITGVGLGLIAWGAAEIISSTATVLGIGIGIDVAATITIVGTAVPIVWIAVAAVIIIAAIFTFFKKKPPKQYEYGSSRLSVTFGSTNSYSYAGGTNSSTRRTLDQSRAITIVHDISGGTQELLSITDDFSVYSGIYSTSSSDVLSLVAPEDNAG